VPSSAHTLDGEVVAAFGRRYEVACADGALLTCVTRGKKTGVACGDRVEILPDGKGTGVIESILPRSSLIHRSDAQRAKLVAANVTLVVIVVAPEPTPVPDLTHRCLAAAESQGLPALVAVNKADLGAAAQALLKRWRFLEALGYGLVGVSAHGDVNPLAARIEGHTALFVGQSGMGKSSLLNVLAPHAHAATAEISTWLDSGRHTTTHARMYRVNDATRIVDAPGVQEFGLAHLDAEALARAFPELRERLGQCRFRNCRHVNEPGCRVLDDARAGLIDAQRLACYQRLLKDRGAVRLY
jgi:ribosome biogenesis GTPase